jgi:hypothetical protein
MISLNREEWTRIKQEGFAAALAIAHMQIFQLLFFVSNGAVAFPLTFYLKCESLKSKLLQESFNSETTEPLQFQIKASGVCSAGGLGLVLGLGIPYGLVSIGAIPLAFFAVRRVVRKHLEQQAEREQKEERRAARLLRKYNTINSDTTDNVTKNLGTPV